MATTTNFGWTTPDDTSLVKDGAAAIRTLGQSIDTSMMDLEGGTTGQVLSKTSGTDMDFTWVTPTVASGPTFRAFPTANQTPGAGALTKVVFNSETWDTDSCFDSTTNYRFTPNKAGYYMVTLGITMDGNPITATNVSIIYKNGSSYENVFVGQPASTTTQCLANGASIINFNGTTDYIEAYVFQAAATSRTIFGTAPNTHFSAVWIRS
jgi:hypothetical protein